MNTFKKFWFESNCAWGQVNNAASWKKMREIWQKGAHGMKSEEIYNARSANYASSVQSFGFRAEHNGTKTLREFFTENEMTL